MKCHRITIPLLLALSVCVFAGDAPTSKPLPLPLPEALITTSYHVDGNGTALIYLIGENHANVKCQQQVAHLLDHLAKSKQLDAILIEGSNGNVWPPDPKLKSKLVQMAKDPHAAERWQGDLDWGRISGYEFFTLTQPSVVVWGVEDMVEKETFAGLFRQDVGGLRKQLNDSVAVLRLTVESVKQKNSAAAERLVPLVDSYAESVQKEIDTTDKALQASSAVSRVRSSALKASKRYEQLLDTPGLKQGMELEKRFSDQVHAYNTGVAKAREMSVEIAPDLRAAAQLQLELTRRKETLETLKPEVDAFESKYRATVEELSKLADELRAFETNLTTTEKRAERPAKTAAEAQRAAFDAYAVAANEIRSSGKALQIETTKVATFWADAQKAAEEDGKSRSDQAMLKARDLAMVANTEEYLRRHPNVHAVALIVGNKHLDGVSAGLRTKQIAFVGGPLASVDEPTESWEDIAWQTRMHRPMAFALTGQTKEISELLAKQWHEAQYARLKLLEKVTPQLTDPSKLPANAIRVAAGSGAILENAVPGQNRALWVTELPADRASQVGAHVADMGPVPGQPAKHYVLFDRTAAREQVKDLSDAKTSFAYFFQTKVEGKTQYRFATSEGVKRRNDVLGRVKSLRNEERLVFFGEPDYVDENGTLRSPIMRDLMTAAGGEGKEPPGTRPPAPTASGDAERPIYFTVNAERAKANFEVIDRMDPSRVGEVKIVENGDFTDIDFTPRRGDHSQMVVLVAKNVEEFRAKVAEAAKEKKLTNKQVALITCGDAFTATAELREMLLREGALLVWVPTRQIDEAAGRQLASAVRSVSPQKTINALMSSAIREVKKNDSSTSIRALDEHVTWATLWRVWLKDGRNG